MRLSNLGVLLEDLQTVLRARGCRVMEVSVTVYQVKDGVSDGSAEPEGSASSEPDGITTSGSV
jgi:hypothetical protein